MKMSKKKQREKEKEKKKIVCMKAPSCIFSNHIFFIIFYFIIILQYGSPQTKQKKFRIGETTQNNEKEL